MNIAGRKQELINQAVTVAGDEFSAEEHLVEHVDGMYIALDISNYVDGNFTLTLQHSFDGVNWYDLQSTTAATANGQTIAKITEDTVLYQVRLKLTSAIQATAVNATVKATLIK